MQKKLIALAIAAAASGAAFAQTNVTIYGIADMGFTVRDNDAFSKNRYGFDSGVLSTSRIGFKGVEDLGNGLKAIFTLEYGLNMDQDQTIGGGTGGLGARQQFVGLSGNFGTIVAGRLQTTGLDFTVAGSALGGSSMLGATNQVEKGLLLNSGSRANNAIAYISPSFGGLTVALNHSRAPLTTEGFQKDANATLVSADYTNGPLSLGAVYGVYTAKDGREVSESYLVLNNAVPPVVTDIGLDYLKKSKEWGVRAGYDFGVAKVQAAYQQGKENGVDALTNVATNVTTTDNWSEKYKKAVISATVPVTAKIAVIGEYAQSKWKGEGRDKAWTLAATYSLSKRTTAYAGYVGINPDGKKNDESRYGVGLRHAF